jgi:hypothetical protein
VNETDSSDETAHPRTDADVERAFTACIDEIRRLRDELPELLETAVEKVLLRREARQAKIEGASEVRRAEPKGGDSWRDKKRTRSESSDPTLMDDGGESSSSMTRAVELLSRARAKKKRGT